MSGKMTLGLTLLALGFAIAALAGIPALIENRVVGDAAVVLGLAVAVVGAVLMLTAIPGQLRDRKERERGRQADIDNLHVNRGRIATQQAMVSRRIAEIEKNISMNSRSRGPRDMSQEWADVRAHQRELVNLAAELAFIDNEMGRKGIEPKDVES